MLANGAFYYGQVRALTEQDRPLWSQMSFAAAADNFEAGARLGIDAALYWPGVGEVPAAELVLRQLLPLAQAGLARWGVDRATSDRLLAVIEGRCLRRQNGAEWRMRGACTGSRGQQATRDRPAALAGCSSLRRFDA